MASALMTAPTEISWVDRLRADGAEGRAAVAELHALLLKAARFEVGRRAAELAHLRGGDQEDLAQQAADDALMAVLRKLDDFRGESRFTTWAYKFAVLQAAVEVRRQAWSDREVPLDAAPPLVEPRPSPDQYAEASELAAAVRTAIDRVLTPHQRRIVLAVVVDQVPIDVLAERLNTTRGALYKTLHDARTRLRNHLTDEGYLTPATRSPGETR